MVGENDAAQAIGRQLADAGHDVTEASPNTIEITTEERPDGIAWLASIDSQANCEGILNLINRLQELEIRDLPCGFNLMTHGGLAVADEETCDPEQAQYWGLGRVLGAEQPGLRCRLLDADSSDEALEQITEFLQTETRENQLALRGGQFLVLRMKSVKNAQQQNTAFAPRKDRSYLITGGLGKLGRQAALWLAKKGLDRSCWSPAASLSLIHI